MADAPGLPPSRAAWRLLVLGAVVGLLLAIAGIVRPGPRFDARLPPGAAAVVDGTVIEDEAFERAVDLLAADSKNPIGEEDRRHVLDRMIEEELLVQRARELGIDEHDRRVRSLLVSAMIDSILADAQPAEPTREEVAQFYRENGGYFTRTGRVHVRPLRFARRDGEDDAGPKRRAEQAAARLRSGDALGAVATELADPWMVPMPDGLLPASKLREYLGPTATLRALDLATGETSEPVQGGRSWFVLQMIDREPEQTPPLEEVEGEVRAEMQRRAGDRALRSYLDGLRERAEVRVRPGITAAPGPS
jgi:hypothetical protein